jgi:hypothetical protein
MLTKKEEGGTSRRESIKKPLAPIEDDKLSRKSNHSRTSRTSNYEMKSN